MGLSPWASPADVYYQKTADYEMEETDAMRIGSHLEGPIVNMAAEELDLRSITRNQFRVSQGADGGIMAATFDALIPDRPEAIEAKCSSVADEWGPAGSDQIPAHYIIQAQHQIHVGELERVWVAALIVRFRPEFRLYKIERHPQLIAQIVKRCTEFWQAHVAPRRPPDGAVAPIEILRTMRREPESVVTLPTMDLVARYEGAKAAVASAEDERDDAQAALIAALGTAEGARLPDGRLLTYLLQQRRSTDTEALARQHPDIAAQFEKTSEYRTLRITKG